MKTVYKYLVPPEDFFEIELPVHSSVLSVQPQGSNIFMWVLLDKNEKNKITRTFAIFGTGQPIKEDDSFSLGFIGTFQVNDERLVFHLFEVYKK